VDRYRTCGKGELAYSPRVLLKLLIYGYATGVVSSRKIAKALQEGVAFRVLACGLSPGHRTICRFREDHLDLFQGLFVQVLQIASEAGLVRLGTIAVDGSKVNANASKRKAMSHGRMEEQEKKLQEEIRKLTSAAEKADQIEDAEFGPDFRGDELPKEIERRADRLKTIQEAKKRLEERKAAEARAKAEAAGGPAVLSEAQLKPEPKDQENFTDPDSRIMKTGNNGFQQSYNAQIAVDAEAQIVVAATVSQCGTDLRQLVPVVLEVVKNTGELPTRVLADTGYRSELNFQAMDAIGVDAYVAVGREGKAAQATSTQSEPCPSGKGA
jgi:transposase